MTLPKESTSGKPPTRHWLLRTYDWRNYDLSLNSPVLENFLAFWQQNLEARCLRRHRALQTQPAELHAIDGVLGCTNSTGSNCGASAQSHSCIGSGGSEN
jgi:uncharacterized protein Usg